MKNIKLILQVLFVSLAIISCTKEDAINGVKVKFYNETGSKIEKLNIGTKEIGVLDINATTNYIIYEEFGFDTGMPDENCSGNINEEPLKSYNTFYWCGTEKTQVEEGIYEMSLKLVEVNSVKYLSIDLK